MKKFDKGFTVLDRFIANKHQPDINNLLKVLENKKPERPTLFEFFLNDQIYNRVTSDQCYDGMTYQKQRRMADTFYRLGYDYITMRASDFIFWTGESHPGMESRSMNTGAGLDSWDKLKTFVWPEPEDFSCERLDVISDYLHDGMGIVVYGPGGIMENCMELIGYDTLCYLLADDPSLVTAICDEIGKRLELYYRECSSHKAVRAVIFNDDWGFKTQTLLSTSDMRRFVVPWTKKIVSVIHEAGKPAILHSCGNLATMIEDISETIGFEAKHSYEDEIMTVEDAYERYHKKFAVLGGIDLNFVCGKTQEEIYSRAVKLLERTQSFGYALGTGNSVPDYVPEANYLAMISAAVWNR